GFPGGTAADNEAVVKRLKAMGFNMVRYWQSPTQDYVKGDNSEADRADHFLWCLQQNGMKAWGAGINGGQVQPGDVDIVRDPATTTAWKEAVGEKGMAIRDNIARIWDSRLESVGIRHMTEVGNHVNRYTGHRWADDPVFAVWELSNEEWWFGKMARGEWQNLPPFFRNQLLQKWNGWLQNKYGTDDKLRAAWNGLLPGESLKNGAVVFAPMGEPTRIDAALNDANPLARRAVQGLSQKYTRDDFARARGEGVIAFLLDLWVSHKKREADAVKALGKSMRLSPLVWDTGIGYEIQSQYLHQQADAVAHDTYVTGFHHDPAHKRYPWFSGLEEQPRLCWDKPWVEQNRVEGKPYFVYETQIEQPAKYRAEYPMRIAALGAIQDWDIVCWHYFGSVPDSTQPKPYEKTMDYTTAGGHPQGYHYQFDEVQMAAMRTAAAVFTQGLLKPAPNPTTFVFGRKSLLDPASMNYGRSYGEPGAQFMPTTYRYGMRLRIDPTREGDEVIGPTYKPRVYEPCPLTPTEEIAYDWHRGNLRFDAPGVAMFTGFFAQLESPQAHFGKSGVTLSDVVVVNPPGTPYPVGADEKYVEFSVASADGKPLPETRRAVLSLVSTSFNSGFQLDLSKLTQEFGWFL
ncbi:MAG: hypothetical protein H7145_16335, partial [Akkermansiaceae bacterium]|nr:hypothetical protein [Armatimonadota bacterium]